jgi:23S rRNA (uracil1939-C5)-methyltransferase
MARPGDLVEIAIERIGAQGDGIGRAGTTPVYLPLALPGERWRVQLVARRGDGFAARPLEQLAERPRQPPPCRHFGACGGCQLQHLAAADYALWQQQTVVEALARRGLREVAVAPVQVSPPASRRRVRLAFAGIGARLRLGLRERAGRRVVDLAECPIARPEIVLLLPALRLLLRGLASARQGGEVLLTASASGLDLLLQTALPPTLADREALAGLAAGQDLARLAWRAGPHATAEPIAARRPVVVELAGVAVELPPGAFLQATGFAEQAIRAAVLDAIGAAPRVADLFAGCGTLGLPLAAARRRVQAYDADPALLAAAAAGAREASCGGRFATATRDLERAPLSAPELARFDAVILDPPRAGARAQAAALAATRAQAAPLAQAPPGRIAMVSCDPATFARDARTLVDGGWQLAWVRPVDAFLWSAQIELVGAFTRPDQAPAGA